MVSLIQQRVPDERRVALLELGCGAALHLNEACTQLGTTCVGIDNCYAMVQHAHEVCDADREILDVVSGDMYSLTQLNAVKQYQFFDGILLLQNSIADPSAFPDGIISLLQQCAEYMQRLHSVLVLELDPLCTLFNGSLVVCESDPEIQQWAEKCEDGSLAIAEVSSVEPAFDLLKQADCQTVSLQRLDPSGAGLLESISETVSYRRFTYGEVELLAQLAGLRIHSTSGSLENSCVAADADEAASFCIFLEKA